MLRYALLIPTVCLAAAAAEAPAQVQPSLPSSHQEFSTALLEFLAETELCLGSCTDSATTEAALPRLRELAERARRLAAHQSTLPEPTVQDYMAAHRHVGEFNRLWEAIGGHIERLENEKLLTAELRELLHIAPNGQ